MEKRTAKIIINKVGGNSSENSKNYKISLPSSWINSMKIDENNREIELSFDGEKITISKKETVKDFVLKAKENNHKLLKISYFDKNDICTEIYYDKNSSSMMVKNHTKNILKTAFGNIEYPTIDDLNSFLESRCVSRDRAGIKDYLKTIGLMDYEPLEIVKRTKGKMAEDEQWLKVEEI